jgi:Fusaric acid resistance protein-like/Aromatic acid exporter family member 2
MATMSLGILAYLRQTAEFFIRQRLLWALIMAAIGFGSHAGQGIVGFLSRIAGTVIAMCAAMAIWYMGEKKPPAILPLLYIYMFCVFYIFVKKPQYIVVAILSIITSVLIIGYELQVSKIGLDLAESNGQPYYPTYELAPYRLATVVGGLFVAFFWTYIPYPITTHGTLRRELGSTLYLLGNYYSCVHTTAHMRLQDGLNYDESKKNSPMARLAKARMKVFTKLVILLGELRESSNLTRFEPTFGGKFPKQTYDDLIASMQSMFNCMTLISYSTKTFTHETTESQSDWLKDFRHFASDLNITSQELTSTLCLVSSSITNSQPLPPYLKTPRPFDLAERMKAVDPDILSLSHVSQPCYAAFAVLQVASSLITEEMEQVVKHVKELVGEVDFSFHIISTSDDSSSFSENATLLGENTDSRKSKKQ